MTKAVDPRPFDAHALEKIDSPEATAAAYFSVFRSPRATERDYEDFESWHARDEANRIAWASVERTWEGSAAMRTEARILEIRERALANRRGRKAWVRPAMAACLALAMVSGAVAVQRHREASAPVAQAVADSRVISTGVGQQSTFRMTDGSVITANTATALTVAESDTRRSTTIREGEAFFEVAKNPRKPFTVTAGGVTVTALGTQFAVRTVEGRVDVTLAEGQVRNWSGTVAAIGPQRRRWSGGLPGVAASSPSTAYRWRRPWRRSIATVRKRSSSRVRRLQAIRSAARSASA
jgi:transmembrane sensor